MGLFLIPLLLGFALAGASAFTAAYSRWWGERGGQIATSVLRNFLGIPLWMLGFILAWLQPAPFWLVAGPAARAVGWLFVVAGSVPFIWGHLLLGWWTHMPSVRDTLVRDGLYGQVRHPIYAGGLLIFIGLALVKPTATVVLACALGFIWLIIQARLEEIDLLQRIPAYGQYMEEVPRFVPRIRRRGAMNTVGWRAGLVLLAFLAIAAFFLLTEHRAHLFGVLPFLLLLLCPALHWLMHGGHGEDNERGLGGDKK